MTMRKVIFITIFFFWGGVCGNICLSANVDHLVGLLHRGLTPLNSYGHIMAVGNAHVFPGFLTPVLTQLFFPKSPTTFLTCFWRGERQKNTPEGKFASTGYRTHNHQVMSPTRSLLSHPGEAQCRSRSDCTFCAV